MVKKRFFVPFFLTIAVSAISTLAGSVIGNWAVGIDASGGVSALTLSNPKTYLNIESSVVIAVDYQGTPVSGTVTFRDGVQRACTPEEVNFYWNEYKGPHSIWEYFASVNKVDLFNPDDALIPANMYGRFSRIVTKAGIEYFGKLTEFSTNPDWFVMQIQGSSVTMYRHAIAMIQQLK
jgi:hypothetical protein